MKNTMRCLGIIALAAIIGFSFSACGDGGDDGDRNSITYTGYDSSGAEYKLVISKGTGSPDNGGTPGNGGNPDNGGTPGSGNRDSRLVNGANDAWVDSYEEGNRDGYIFNANGTCQLIDDYTDTTPGEFAVYGAAVSWSTSGNNSLTLAYGGKSVTYSYTVAGTTLTFTGDGESAVYTKQTVTVSGRSVVSPTPAGAPGNKAGGEINLVVLSQSSPANRAAAYAPQKGDKFVLTIKNASGKTEGTSTGTVSNISGNTLTLENGGKTFTAKIKDLAIEEISGPIPLDGGGELPAPVSLTPKKPGPSGGGGGGGSNWTWTAVADSKFGTSNIYDIAYLDGKFFAVGSGGRIAYSANGTTWTAVENSTFKSVSINAIAYGGSKFIAVGNEIAGSVLEDKYGLMAYSTDGGVTWTNITENITGLTWSRNGTNYNIGAINAIAYGNGKFVVGSTGGFIAYSSNDGTSWTAVQDTTFRMDTQSSGVNSIAYGNGKFVAVGGGNGTAEMAYSTDGASWTKVSISGFNEIESITFGNGKFVAVGQGGRYNDHFGKVAYSTDGINWQAVDNILVQGVTGETSNLNAVAFGNGRFVTGGFDGSNGVYNGRIGYSTDGASWTKVSTSPFDTSEYRDAITGIAYGGGKFVAVGQRGKMAYADW